MQMTAVDRLLLAFLGILAALAAAFVAEPGPVLAAVAAMMLSILATARLRGRFPWLEVVHAFLPVPILALLVNVIGPVVQSVNPMRWDAVLSSMDARFFGSLVAAWRNAGGRPDWLVDAASLAYSAHYLLPVAVAALLWAKGRRADFDRFSFSISATLVLLYAMYFVVPAAGPRVADAVAGTELGGGPVTAALRAFLRVCERNELDAFPSGHTALPLVVLAQCWTRFQRARVPLAMVVAAIVFSTVYLSFHYVVDVLGGVALAAVIVPLSSASPARESRVPRTSLSGT